MRAKTSAMAVLFALDRGAAREHLEALCAEHDVVILDRYVASNAAYSAARLNQDAHGDRVEWVGDLEYRRLGLPAPDRQILLDVSVVLAAERAIRRAGEEPDRARDAYERDAELQQRTGAVYAGLAARHWHGPWSVAAPDVDAAQLAAALLV